MSVGIDCICVYVCVWLQCALIVVCGYSVP